MVLSVKTTAGIYETEAVTVIWKLICRSTDVQLTYSANTLVTH